MERLTLHPCRMALWLAILAACGDRGGATPARQAEVAERGAEVMPFDLDKTRHRFLDLADGGLQTVTALDPSDTTNVRLIREHLRLEATRFSGGEFDDPMAIHGHAMPGLAELRGAGRRIAIEYTPENGGGRIRYTTADPALVAALHRWFVAQRADHGVHGR